MSSVKLSRWLIKNAKVATVPGTDFGKCGENHLRLSYAADFNLIKQALDKIEKNVRKLK